MALLSRGRRGLGSGTSGLQPWGWGLGKAKRPLTLSQKAWEWHISPGVSGAPALFPGHPAFQKPLRSVACSTTTPATQAAGDTWTPKLLSGQVQDSTAVSPGRSLA